MSKFCKKCGAELNDNARFCPKCGSMADETLSQTEKPSEQSVQQPVMPAPQPEKKKSSAVPVIIAVVLALVLICGGFFAYLGISGKSISDVFNLSDGKKTEETSEKSADADKTEGSTEAPKKKVKEIDPSKITVPEIRKLVEDGTVKSTIDIDSYLTYDEIMEAYENRDSTSTLSEKQAVVKKYPALQRISEFLCDSLSASTEYDITEDTLLELMDVVEENGFAFFAFNNQLIYAADDRVGYTYYLVPGDNKMVYMNLDDIIALDEGGETSASGLCFLCDYYRNLEYVGYLDVHGAEAVGVFYLPDGKLYMYEYEDESGQVSYFDSDFNPIDEEDVPDDIVERLNSI